MAGAILVCLLSGSVLSRPVRQRIFRGRVDRSDRCQRLQQGDFCLIFQSPGFENLASLAGTDKRTFARNRDVPTTLALIPTH